MCTLETSVEDTVVQRMAAPTEQPSLIRNRIVLLKNRKTDVAPTQSSPLILRKITDPKDINRLKNSFKNSAAPLKKLVVKTPKIPQLNPIEELFNSHSPAKITDAEEGNRNIKTVKQPVAKKASQSKIKSPPSENIIKITVNNPEEIKTVITQPVTRNAHQPEVKPPPSENIIKIAVNNPEEIKTVNTQPVTRKATQPEVKPPLSQKVIKITRKGVENIVNVRIPKEVKRKTNRTEVNQSDSVKPDVVDLTDDSTTSQEPPPPTLRKNEILRLMIPPEYLPKITNTTGPIIIRLPGYPPLIANTSFDQINQQTAFLNMNLPKQPEPEPPPPVPTDNPLWDKKFCWTSTRNRKVDLDGFKCTDRLGFLKIEVSKVRKCARTIQYLANRKDKDLRKQIHKLNKEVVIEPAQLEPITELIEPFATDPLSSEPPKKHKEKKRRKRKHSSGHDVLENDLFYTKKVVILGPDQLTTKEKTVKRRGRKKACHDQVEKFNIKPCFVSVQRIDDTKHKLKSLDPVKQDFKENIIETLQSKYIDTLEKLDLPSNKPLLVINENHLDNFNFDKRSLKNNVVFVAGENVYPKCMFTDNFVRAVEKNLIKIVSLGVLSRHLAGECSAKESTETIILKIE